MMTKRLTQILQFLRTCDMNTASVAELSKICNVSEKTIRQDLDKLESMNVVTRVHGGAVLKKTDNQVVSVASRKQSFSEEKRSIAEAALNLINDGDTVFLDSGSTTLELAKILNKEVIVLTTDPVIVGELLTRNNVTLYCTGGLLSRERDSFVFCGYDAIHLIRKYRMSKSFIGCSAFNFKTGLMVFSSAEAQIKQEIISASEQVICLADASKFNQSAFASFAGLDEIDVCISNYICSESDFSVLKANDIQWISAQT